MWIAQLILNNLFRNKSYWKLAEMQWNVLWIKALSEYWNCLRAVNWKQNNELKVHFRHHEMEKLPLPLLTEKNTKKIQQTPNWDPRLDFISIHQCKLIISISIIWYFQSLVISNSPCRNSKFVLTYYFFIYYFNFSYNYF